jgi:alginate O-acetyltransferase complex protein AlgI
MKLLIGLTTYVAVLVAWVFFRASNFEVASRILGGMFGMHGAADAILTTREILQVAIITVLLLIAHWTLRDSSIEAAVARLPRSVVTCAWAFMLFAIILTQGNSNAFIYFQF